MGLRFSPVLYPKVSFNSTPDQTDPIRPCVYLPVCPQGFSANSELRRARGQQHLQIWSDLPKIWSGKGFLEEECTSFQTYLTVNFWWSDGKAVLLIELKICLTRCLRRSCSGTMKKRRLLRTFCSCWERQWSCRTSRGETRSLQRPPKAPEKTRSLLVLWYF